MADNIKYGIPLGNVDTAWLHMEDPTNLMMVTSVFTFDTLLDFERVRDTIQYRMVDRFSHFRTRVVQQGNKAYWVSDPTFNINAHLHRVGLPSPGDKAALQDMVSDLMSTPLDFSKPLWHLHLIENYGEGCAVLMRLHHCIGDGLALVYVLLSMTEEDPDAPWPTPAGTTESQRGTSFGLLGGLFRSAMNVVNTTRLVTGLLLQEGMETISNPYHALDLAAMAAGSAGALGKVLLLGPDPATLYKGDLGVAKRAAWSQPIPLPDVKMIGRAMGGTVNDVLLTAVTGALRRYMQAHADPTDDVNIRAMVPVNLRPPEEAHKLGNRFGLIYLSLPIYLADPVERLLELKRRMDEIKNTPEALVTFQILNALGLAPLEIADQMVHMFAAKSTAVMTNVPGPRQPMYFAGKEVRTPMFWVPQSGRMGLGVSIFSYNNEVVLGTATDAQLVPDPEAINEAFEDEFRDLLALAHAMQRDAKPKLAAAESIEVELAVGVSPAAQLEAAREIDAAPVQDVQCQGVTQSGRRCKNKAQSGSAYCHMHQN